MSFVQKVQNQYKVTASSCSLSIHDLKALEAFVRNDADNAQKNSLNGFFWQVAEGLGLVDDKGNYLEMWEREVD